MKLRHITIDLPDGTGRTGRIAVDGQQIHPVAITVRACVDEITTVDLELGYVSAEIDGEAFVSIPQHTHNTLVALGWTPPGGIS